MKIPLLTSAALLLFLLENNYRAFALLAGIVPRRATSSTAKSSTGIFLTQNSQFDLSKPVFDLLTLRSIRGDALLRYNSLNQSEPFRINLYAVLALALFSVPTLIEESGVSSTVEQTAASVLAGVAHVGLFVRECQRRSNQLYRMEKELNSEMLQLRLPANVFSSLPFTGPTTLGMLAKAAMPPRIVVVSGTLNRLSSVLTTLRVFGQRLQQANTFIVPVPTDGSTRQDLLLLGITTNPPWLADAYDLTNWLEYLEDLSKDKQSDDGFRWFGLNSNGRSFGSGTGTEPQWLELLGQYLRPTVILPEETKASIDTNNSEETRSILEAQTKFYEALTSGDVEGMKSIWQQSNPSPDVTQVIEDGGRLIGWPECLTAGARPEGMRLSGSDASIVSNSLAYSTIIECPSSISSTQTLLAVQQWSRDSVEDQWKLALHQTIPWTPEVRAQGTLRCDCRGCVALTRGAEKRTFGGITG